MYYELTPAYGRDFTTKAAVIAAFKEGYDFNGDYQCGFKPCNIDSFKPGDTVNLRYKANRAVTPYKIVKEAAAK